MGRINSDGRKERHSGDPKSSVKAPPKKGGGGGKFTMGKVGSERDDRPLEEGDPNYDPDEKRVDPDDGVAYTFEALAEFYKGKFSKQAVREYWDKTCTAVKRERYIKVKDGLLGPTPYWAAPFSKAKVKPKPEVKRLTPDDMEGKGPLAKEIAAVIPNFPFKKLDKYYDIQGLLHHPKLLNAMCAIFAKRYRRSGITKVCAFEARGFLFATVSIKLGVPFIMLRKDGKMPNTVSSAPYTKEYEDVNTLCVQKGAIVKGDKVVLIDDFVATGGTLCAGIELMKAMKAEVVECGCMIELEELGGRERAMKAGAKNVWGFIKEDLLTTEAKLPDGNVVDGK